MMMAETDYTSLIARLEQSSGEDREVDLAIGQIWPPPQPFSVSIARLRDGKPALPAFTSSLDAVLAFAEAALPGWGIALTRYPRNDGNPEGWYVTVYDPGVPSGRNFDSAESAAPARALLIAILHALRTKDKTND